MLLAWTLALIACLSLSIEAHASPRRAVVVAPPGDKLGTQLSSELVSASFEPLVIPPPGSVVARAFLESALRQYQAAGVLQVVSGATAVQVWVWSNTQRELVLADLVYQPGDEDTDRSLVAVRAVEALRAAAASPVPAPPSPSASSSSAPAPPPPSSYRVAQRPGRSSFLVAAGAAMLLSPGGIGPLLNGEIQAQVRMPSSLLVRLLASLPVTHADESSAAGTSEASATLLSAGVGLGAGGSTRGYAALGVGMLRFQSKGTAIAPYAGHVDSAYACLMLAHVGGRIPLVPWVGLRGDLTAGLSVPELSVHHAQTKVATFGRPLVSTSVGLDVVW
ncbi:MAG: hypothetical protein HY898_04115 [Deltaproteobacteria bacterium]|nr:hypothetical protein [Deltaproteobacteria bacterium]